MSSILTLDNANPISPVKNQVMRPPIPFQAVVYFMDMDNNRLHTSLKPHLGHIEIRLSAYNLHHNTVN